MLKTKRNGPGSYYYWDAELGVEFHIVREEYFTNGRGDGAIDKDWRIRFSHNSERASDWEYPTKAQALEALEQVIATYKQYPIMRARLQRERSLEIELTAYSYRDNSPAFMASLDELYRKSEWWRQVRAMM